MAYSVEFSEDAEHHLSLLTARDRGIILDAVERQLADDPTVATRNRKFLRPNPLASWQLRVGEFRVFYNVDTDQETVIIVAIGAKVHNVLLIAGRAYSL